MAPIHGWTATRQSDRQKLERARESYEEARDAFSAHRGLAECCPQAWWKLGELAVAIDDLERDLDR
ncbi:MAG: hypothetical protein OXE43_11560 [Chloroflexi bacterium]|nr:hypothetical protein [Chloroflexota bacterium]